MNVFYAAAMAGGVVVNIGQLKAKDKYLLDAAVKRGKLAKWRGHWWPVSGASYGIGPLKTCYGLPEVKESLCAA